MTPRIYGRGIKRYKVERQGRQYVISQPCDCILGPHWHTLTITPTVAEAEVFIDTEALADQGRR